MADWKPNLYLSFEKERTQPSIDLVTKIDHENPIRIIDIGCGPGNSTNVLKARWPKSEIIGLDNSQAMIAQAKETFKDMQWVCTDASNDLSNFGKFDIVFSNAAIQWIPNQKELLINLFNLLNPGGVLAVQVPNTSNMPMNIELMKLVDTEKWKKHFVSLSNTRSTYHEYHYYYDILCDLSNSIDMWVTNYCHIMSSHAEIIKWYSGTGLRPYLDCFNDENTRNEFLHEYESILKNFYPVQKDGKILFPFTRIFFTIK